MAQFNFVNPNGTAAMGGPYNALNLFCRSGSEGTYCIVLNATTTVGGVSANYILLDVVPQQLTLWQPGYDYTTGSWTSAAQQFYGQSVGPLGSPRRLPLVGDLVSILKDWKASQEPAQEDLILPRSAGQRQIYEDWWKIRELAGVGKVRFKDFRSTLASELLLSGSSTVTAKEFLGHSDTLTLERNYANVLPGLRHAAEQREKR